MKMNEITSKTWQKIAEIKTENFNPGSLLSTINSFFGYSFYEDADEIKANIKEGFVEICDDGVIIWIA